MSKVNWPGGGLIFLFFTPIWGNGPIWRAYFFKRVETNHQRSWIYTRVSSESWVSSPNWVSSLGSRWVDRSLHWPKGVAREILATKMPSPNYWVVATQIFFMFTPKIWGRWTHFDKYFSKGFKPPTRLKCFLFKGSLALAWCFSTRRLAMDGFCLKGGRDFCYPPKMHANWVMTKLPTTRT